MLEKLLPKLFQKFDNSELEKQMLKLRNELNQLQIDELKIKSNYSLELKDNLTQNNKRQYQIIDSLYQYQSKNPRLEF